MRPKRPVSPERRRDRLIGLLIIVLAFFGCMALSVWGKSKSTPRLAPDPAPPTSVGIIGFPDKVDPLTLVERARDMTVRIKFRGFVASAVAPDGTMNFERKNTSLRIAFQSPSGLGPQPPRAGGTLPERRYCGLQSVFVKEDGMFATPDQPERSCPHEVPENIPLPTQCSLADVWDLAIKRKVPRKGVARIEFFESFAGPAYRFKRERHSFIVSAHDCSKVLSGQDARGFVP